LLTALKAKIKVNSSSRPLTEVHTKSLLPGPCSAVFGFCDDIDNRSDNLPAYTRRRVTLLGSESPDHPTVSQYKHTVTSQSEGAPAFGLAARATN
jgi:hypothetical protein